MIRMVDQASAADRLKTLNREQKRRRRRGFLLGLLVGQLVIIAMDLGGTLFLRTHPQVKLQAPVGVPSIVFLGMAVGAALMIAVLALIFGAAGLRGLFRKASASALAGGFKRLFMTSMALGVSIGVIIGTAWFMIPQPDWLATVGFAKSKGAETVESSKQTFKAMWRR